MGISRQHEVRGGVAEGDGDVAAGKEVQQVGRHAGDQLCPALVGVVDDLGAVGVAEIVEDDLPEALFGQLPGNLLQICHHGFAVRIQPVEAVAHPEGAAGGPQAGGNVVQGEAGVLEGPDAGHHREAVAPQPGDRGVHSGDVNVSLLCAVDGGRVVEGAVAALEVDHHGAGRAQLLHRLQHGGRVLEHLQVDVEAVDPGALLAVRVRVGVVDDDALHRVDGGGAFRRQLHVPGGVAPEVQASAIRGVDYEAAQIDRKEDHRQQQHGQDRQTDFRALLQPHPGAVGYGSQAQPSFCAVKQHQSFRVCRPVIRRPAASMAARTSS